MTWRFLVDVDTDTDTATELDDRGNDAATVAATLRIGKAGDLLPALMWELRVHTPTRYGPGHAAVTPIPP